MNFKTKLFIFSVAVIFSLITCSTSKNSVSNNSLKEIYFDENMVEISRDEFKSKVDYHYNLDIYVQKDSIIYCYLVNRLRQGRLPSEHFEIFKTQLQNSTGASIDFNVPLRIVYYQKVSIDNFDCLKTDQDSEYRIIVEQKKKDFKHLHICSSNYEFDESQYKILVDQFDLLKNVFIKQAFTCLNYILVYPDGTYGSCLGDGCEEFTLK